MGRYFPDASPNTLCIQNVIDALPSDRYEVEVVSYEDNNSADYNITVSKFSRSVIQTLIYKNENKTSFFAKQLVRTLSSFLKVVQLLFIFSWPWTDPITTNREFKIVLQRMKKRPADIIIAVYMPLSSLIVAHRIKQLYPETQYIAYFLDALYGGYVPRFMSKKLYERKALKWEKRVLSNADRIIFMESARNHNEAIYKDENWGGRVVYLDLPMLKPLSETGGYTNAQMEGISLLYIGSLALNVRSPEYFLKVFSLIHEPDWNLYFIGEKSCKPLNDYAKKDKRVKVIGRCTHEEALELGKKATVLVNLGNRNPSLTPSKIFEYMSLRKKIVSTFSIDEDSSAKYLSKYPLSLLLDERDTNYAKAAMKLKEFVVKEGLDVSYNRLEELFYANTPTAFINLIEDIP